MIKKAKKIYDKEDLRQQIKDLKKEVELLRKRLEFHTHNKDGDVWYSV